MITSINICRFDRKTAGIFLFLVEGKIKKFEFEERFKKRKKITLFLFEDSQFDDGQLPKI